jgi:multicomponent Na+:H+ antiporter subunit C
MIETVLGHFNYWVSAVLIMVGLYIVMANANLVKKVIGLTVFQSAVFILYISLGKVDGGSAPILSEAVKVYSNPLPHVLILTAIVVGVATTAVALALSVRIHQAYGSLEEDDIKQADQEDLH